MGRGDGIGAEGGDEGWDRCRGWGWERLGRWGGWGWDSWGGWGWDSWGGRGWDSWGGVVDSYQGVIGVTESGYYLIVFFLSVLLTLVLSCPLSLFLSDQNMIVIVSVSVLKIYFLCLWSL